MAENPYQDVIDWLRSAEGCAWSEARMKLAAFNACLTPGSMSWHLNRSDRITSYYPMYMAGVLSVKDDLSCEPMTQFERELNHGTDSAAADGRISSHSGT